MAKEISDKCIDTKGSFRFELHIMEMFLANLDPVLDKAKKNEKLSAFVMMHGEEMRKAYCQTICYDKQRCILAQRRGYLNEH
ncbi:hypothetical protein ACFL96_13925 [Thermoproteota archaeon]